MTTKPSDLNPSLWVAQRRREHAALEGFELAPLNSAELAIIAYLDERHAAGQGEEPWWGVWCELEPGAGFWRASDEVPSLPMQTVRADAERLASSLNESQAGPDSVGWRYEAHQIGARIAMVRPGTLLRCSHGVPVNMACKVCGENSVQRTSAYGVALGAPVGIAHTCQLAQSTTGADCPRCKVLGIDRFTVDPVAAGPELTPCPGCGEPFQPNDGIGGHACSKCCDKPLPVAAPPAQPEKPAIWCPVHQRPLPCKWCANSSAAQPVAAEPAVPVAGEPRRRPASFQTLLERIGRKRGNSGYVLVLNGKEIAELITECDALLKETETAVDRAEGAELSLGDRARTVDAALAQVEQLKGELRKRDQLESSLRDDVTEAQANAEARHSEFQGQCAETVRLREALTAANERAARLEAERPHLLEAARLLPLARRDWRGVVDSDVRRFAIDMAAWERASEPPPVATGERPIVVGSKWRNNASGILHTVLGEPADAGDYHRRYTWESDPPTPATGGEGETQ